MELFNDFELFLQQANNDRKELLITRDLNCNFLHSENNISLNKIQDLMDIYQLQQHIKSPTRVTLTSATLIDVIFSQINNNKIIEAGVIDLGISDHNLVYICRKVSIPKEKFKFF